jgi:Leucine-rich repeat (LRR) protein
MEENLVFALEGHCSVNSQRTGRHLTIESTWDRDISVYQSIELSRLRSLTVFGKWESFLISDKMRILRVLDLEDSTSVTDGDLERMVKLLPRLKFLSLRGCKEVTHLPDSFGGGLKQLQTLDIRHTFIATLPLSITKLHKLQHIRAGTSVSLTPDGDASTTVESLPTQAAIANNLVSRFRLPELCACSSCFQWLSHSAGSRNGGVEAPRGIGKMVALHNISVIDISVANGRAILEELKNLTQLRKLGVSGVNQQNCKQFCFAISGHHPHLKSLSVWLDDRNQTGCLDAISAPPQRLQSLKLYGCVDKLPAWIKLLSNLSKLKLQMEMITQEEVDLLGHLPSLRTLCLYPKDFQYGVLRFNESFRQLMLLEIACNSKLQSIRFEYCDVMNVLEVLKIHCFHVSSLKLLGLNKLNGLKEVSLSGSYDDKVKQHMQTEIQQHPKKVKPDLKVIQVPPPGR